MVTNIQRWAQGRISEEGMKRVKDAVAQAELSTSGEIVPMMVKSSTDVPLATTVIFLGLALTALAGFELISKDWIVLNRTIMTTAEWTIAVLSWPIAHFAARFDGVRHFLCSHQVMKRHVDQRAVFEFYAAGLNNTRDATGIMLFVSLMERRAVVLADHSIAHKLSPETWNGVLEILVRGTKQGDMAQGFVDAIAKCGEILAPHFPRKADDTNELPDGLIISE